MYDRKAIMTEAWALLRKKRAASTFTAEEYARHGWSFADCLSYVWSCHRALAAPAVKPSLRQEIESQLQALDYADSFTFADNQKRQKLREELAQLEGRP